MATQHINPEGLPKPGAWSQVVIGTGTRIVSVAGQVGIGVDGKLAGAGDFAAQTRQAFRNVQVGLEAAGATFDDVTKITVFVAGYDAATHLQPINAARSEVIPGEKPASTLVGVQALASPELLVEVEALAVLG